ncbi:MAG: hypothetical protein AAF604_02185 [Acidobacteriota bacterium]
MTGYFLILLLTSSAFGEASASGARIAPPLDAGSQSKTESPLTLEPPHTLWNLEEKTGAALFISGDLIDQVPRDELPADDYCLRALSRSADFHKMATSPETWYVGLPKQGCSFVGSRRDDSTVDREAEISNTVQTAKILLTAKVRSDRIGWNCHRSRVERIVVVDILEVIKGDLSDQDPQQALFLDTGGSLTFEGRKLCTFPIRNQYRPQIGDTVVVAAKHFEPSNRLLHQVTVLPSEDGSIYWLTDSLREGPSVLMRDMPRTP